MFYKNNPLHFECTGCGQCCFGDHDSIIETSEAERERIRAFLGVSTAWFRQRYLSLYAVDQLGLRIEPSGRCVFLDAQMRCRIYPLRPRQCRTYPYWPEVVATAEAWKQESKRCEGIGRGKRVSVEFIDALVAPYLHREHS